MKERQPAKRETRELHAFYTGGPGELRTGGATLLESAQMSSRLARLGARRRLHAC